MQQQSVRESISKYFDNPTLTKTENNDEFSIYMTKNNSLLATVHRYIIVFVPKDTFFIGSQRTLSDLKWTIFQTRSLVSRHPANTTFYSYIPKKTHPYNTGITILRKEPQYSTYTSSIFPITITLLNMDDSFFPDHGTINSALETYSTMIQFIGM